MVRILVANMVPSRALAAVLLAQTRERALVFRNQGNMYIQQRVDRNVYYSIPCSSRG